MSNNENLEKARGLNFFVMMQCILPTQISTKLALDHDVRNVIPKSIGRLKLHDGKEIDIAQGDEERTITWDMVDLKKYANLLERGKLKT